MALIDCLRELREPVPSWLEELGRGIAFPAHSFLRSRLVYYPGSGTDGHPVKLFGSTHSAHCFIYADYGLSQQDLRAELDHPTRGFQGYHSLLRVQLRVSDLVPSGWVPSLGGDELPREQSAVAWAATAPSGFIEVLERDEQLDDAHGARRLAILFLGADGIAAFDALFCQENSLSAPFAIVLQDHGFGGNYDRFGRGSLLERIARRSGVLPPWLLVAEDTKPWDGYERVAGVSGERGGMHHVRRFLFARQGL